MLIAEGLEGENEVPVGDVLDAVDADTIDVKVSHPAGEVRQHVALTGRKRTPCRPGDRIV
jgi:hypothetical protein